jgi:hypothetical protein
MIKRFVYFAYSRYVDTLAGLSKLAKAVLRVLAELVDFRTGATHPRFPVTLDVLSARVGCVRQTLCYVLDEIEARALFDRRRQPKTRDAFGRTRQRPTEYTLHVPDDCWKVLDDVRATAAAREPEAPPVRRNVEPHASPAAIVLSVRGKLPTRGASNVAGQTSEDLDAWQTLDGITTSELAAQMVEVACVAAAECEEDRRYLAVASIYALSRRASELAYEAIQGGLMQTRVLSSVKEWAARCLLNAAQTVESPAHAVNILRRFVQSAKAWEDANARG